jgi:uncharacterized protein (TIGR03067 family)
MASDADPRLQGVWRLLSCTSGGTEVGVNATHRVFEGARTWEIDPDHVVYDDQPPPEARFEIDAGASPTRITVHNQFAIEDGSFAERPRRALYAVDDQHLTIAWTGFRDFPTKIDGHDGLIDRLARETDAALIARHRVPPARMQRFRQRHPDLGELEWDANLDWWRGHVAWAGHSHVRFNVGGSKDAGAGLFDRAAAILRRMDALAIYRYAAAGLLTTHNDGWRKWVDEAGKASESPVLSAEEFMAKLSPEAVSIDADGGVDVYFNDGHLFWGHAVVVSIDAALTPVRVDIAG